ncbi:UNVERIFIED_CONTAM: hypothetical protein FKN15_000703 [Acipenser sinensis]
MTLIEGAHIQCSLRPHPALERVMHLLPQNMLVSGAETIPGVVPPTEDVDLLVSLLIVVDCLQKPRLFKTVTCYLDKVSLSLYPSLERFEEELLELLNTDRLNREDSGPDGNSVVIQERRLHIAVHNGWGFVDKPQMSSTTSFSKTAYMQSVRWAVWNPFLEAGSSEVSLSLQGGPLPNPNSVMVYKATSTDMSSPEVKELERGTLKVRFSSRQEGRLPSPAPERKPPSSALRRSVSQVQDSSPKSPPGPGLSVSQLSVSPRYPTISHSTASPWQQQFPSQLYPSPMAGSYQLSHAELPFASSIAHLEADLSCSAAQSNSPGAEQLQELPFNPVHAPIIALGTQVSSTSSTISRSSLVRLHSSGFPEIVDCNNQAAEVVDPADPVNFSPNREESDYLQCNEIILQFLAFTRTPQEGMETDWPKSVYFTFQLYRFPPVTSQLLLLVNTDRSASRSRDPAPCILVQVNKDGTVNSGSPGLQLKYMVDPGFLKLGEQRWFIRYLALQTLQIDVWDAESLLLIGSSAVELKHLLRQGRAAVQVIHELEVITTEYVQDSVGISHHGRVNAIGVSTIVKGTLHLRMGNHLLRQGRAAVQVIHELEVITTEYVQDSVGISHYGRVNAIGVSTIVKGTLHLRMGNVGHLSEHRLKHADSLPPSLSRVVSSHDSTSSFTGGSLSSTSISNLNAKNASRARRLPDIDGELASMLCSRMKEASIALQHVSGETGSTRQRKLERMVAVRQYEAKEGDTMPYIMVSFRAEDGKPLAICQVNVEPTPHVIDQTFRFYHPELTFLKKSIRLPPWHILPGTPVGVPSGEPQIYVRCSDPNVICETKKMRVDVTCLTGQLTRLSLVLRGTQTVRKVKCYSSHPHLLQIDPADVFVLPPNAVQDLHIGVRPQKAGSKFLYLNVVDVDYHQLVSSWLVCVSCKQPLISKAFEISLSAGKGSNKKITYTNPYPTRRAHFLCTNRTDLLQFKEDAFEIGGGETYTIGLRFAPSQSTGEEEILIYINDQEHKNEETFCVKVVYS